MNPHDAGLEWFTGAHLGLSVFFGLHALLGRHEDVLSRDKLDLAQYVALQKHFKGEHFDAIDIVELAIAAGARYIVFPACYDDGFCLFNTAQTDFNSVKSAAQRDFLGEIASSCEYHGLGLCLEYTFGVNLQRYPNGIPATKEAHDEYAALVSAQLHELMNTYGPIAAICFGGIRRIHQQLPSFDVQDCYDLIHNLQPNTLVAYRQGFNGQEDFYSVPLVLPTADSPAIDQGFVTKNRQKPLEIRMSLTPGQRGYSAEAAGKHMKLDALWEELRKAHRADANLLVNTALMPDGSLDLEDINTLLELGKRLEAHGRPG